MAAEEENDASFFCRGLKLLVEPTVTTSPEIGSPSASPGGDATPQDDPRTYDYSRASRSCDVVMKGGITSGVVYPYAVCELARTYRFRNIGGTSAGAIAAAAAAAAEFGRASGGFMRFAALPAWIGEGTHVLSLFQPQRPTRPLFRLLLALIARERLRPLRVIGVAAFGFPLAALLGLAPGVLLVVAGCVWGSGALLVISVVVGALLLLAGLLISLIAAVLRRLTRAVPDNYFGLCSGHSRPGQMPAALTPWLCDQLDRFAGAEGPLTSQRPLTFGDLWRGPDSDTPPEAGERWLSLEMMTTNLTNRRPERLPWQTSDYFFDPEQFRQLFPARVVDWIESNPPSEPEATAERRDRRLRLALMRPLLPLPDGDKLPVILAARMSLSFPLLLSAIPLWTIDMSRASNQAALKAWREWAKNEQDWEAQFQDTARRSELASSFGMPKAEVCWFSDGGISSNFPIHFFDSPLPRWPTFGVNLRSFHPDHPRSPNESENVWMPNTNAGGILQWWYRFPGKARPWTIIDGRVVAFAGAVVRTMQNRIDEAQMRMPGYRDRVVHIGQDPDEGGMNLTMNPEVIRHLTARGRFAGAKLVARFATPEGDGTPLTWANHRWVRYRSTMAALEQMLRGVSRGYDGVESPDELTYEELITRSGDDPPGSYRWERATQQNYGLAATHRLVDEAARAEAAGETFAEGAPQPAPHARIAPEP